eukprot:Anaeramoba_ignava/c18938_g2_i2.p1 GENE.c18938_g2_i2~~c18938_g2_i2.p1  ORF type:complete len:380 (-),score=112.77 c18938_g2_i2:205-1344(-)
MTLNPEKTVTIDKEKTLTLNPEKTLTLDKEKTSTIDNQKTLTIDKEKTSTLDNQKTSTLDKEKTNTTDINTNSTNTIRTCSNCGTQKTPMWRRGPAPNYADLCNACGCYFRTHLKHRPIPTGKKANMPILSRKKRAKNNKKRKCQNRQEQLDISPDKQTKCPKQIEKKVRCRKSKNPKSLIHQKEKKTKQHKDNLTLNAFEQETHESQRQPFTDNPDINEQNINSLYSDVIRLFDPQEFFYPQQNIFYPQICSFPNQTNGVYIQTPPNAYPGFVQLMPYSMITGFDQFLPLNQEQTQRFLTCRFTFLDKNYDFQLDLSKIDSVSSLYQQIQEKFGFDAKPYLNLEIVFPDTNQPKIPISCDEDLLNLNKKESLLQISFA